MAQDGNSIVYFPDPRREGARRTMGGFLLLAGGGLGCMFLVIGLMVGPLYTANLGQDPLATQVPAVIFPCLAAVFGLGSIGLGLWLLFRPHRGWLELTQEELLLVSGRKSIGLRLAEIDKVSIRRESSVIGRGGHWVVCISVRTGQAIELAVSQPGYLAAYDVQPVLTDLLPRLAAGVEVDGRVITYLETGSMTAEAS